MIMGSVLPGKALSRPPSENRVRVTLGPFPGKPPYKLPVSGCYPLKSRYNGVRSLQINCLSRLVEEPIEPSVLIEIQ